MTWGIGATAARVGLQRADPLTGTLVSLLSGLVLVALAALWASPADLLAITPPIVLWFALVGIANFAGGRYLFHVGCKHLGSARGTSIVATAPLFAILFAALITGDPLTPMVGIGAALIVLGSAVIVSSQDG